MRAESTPVFRVHPIAMGLVHAFLVEQPGGLLLVDAGMPHMEQRVLRRMRRLGRDDLRLIFVTHAHFDHYGSAAALRRLTGARIAVHYLDAPAMAAGLTPARYGRGVGRWMLLAMRCFPVAVRAVPTPADLELRDGDSLQPYGVDGRVVHTPGHTDGSSTLLLSDGTAFVGDFLQGRMGARPQVHLATDWQALPRSLARLAALHPRRIYCGHSGRAFPGNVLERRMGR